MSTLDELERRDFLKKGFAVGAAFSLISLGGLFEANATESTASTKSNKETSPKVGKPDLVAVRGENRVAMLDAALDALGGISTFVKPGQSVVIKPNAAWDKPANLAANTHPSLVAHVVELCLKAGAKEVNVFDHTCDAWQRSYTNSGIQQAVEQAGGHMVPSNDENMYVVRKAPTAIKLKEAKIHKLIADSDVYINMPILKHHGSAVMTACMKNVMGIVWDRGFFHQNDLQQCICDGVLLRKPDLNILDAYSPMMRNGPKGKDAQDLLLTKTLVVSTDPVACDAAGAMILGHKAKDIKHIELAAQAGHGICDLSKLNIKRIKLA
ncbi:MAG: DUF362 domain-containing protein [Akkermansia sp.]